jgi:tetratricopeptide (TPR) repeat protein
VKNLRKIYLLLVFGCLIGLSGYESFAQAIPVTPHDLLPEQNIKVIGKDSPQWKTVWDEARKNALQGDFAEALNLYRELLVKKNNLEEARWELAKLLMYLKRWDEAAGSLEILIGSEPESVLYIGSLGKVMWEMEQYERAVDLFKRIYSIDPSDQLALAGLVEGLTKLDRKSEALPYLEQLSRQEPTNRGVRRYLAFLFFDEGNYEKARIHLTILARNEEVEPDVLYRTAKTYEHLDLDQQASIYWERFVAREPGNIEAHNFLVQYYEKEGQLDRALSHLQAVLENNLEDVVSFARLGETHEKAGDLDKALLYYEKYLENFPDDVDVKRRLVEITAATGKTKETIASLDEYFATDNEQKTAVLKESISQYEAAGRYQDAIPLYKQLIELSPNDPEILAALAHDLLVIGENEGEISMVTYLSDIAPDNIAIYRSMAELLRRLKRKGELLAILNKIHEFDPGDNDTTLELAILYLEKDELLLSQKYFKELSDSNCRNIQCLQARALLSEKLKRPEHELRDYEALLKKQPNRYKVRLRVIYLAANMGLLDTAVYHAGYLQNMPSVSEKFELKILLADAYMKSGYFRRARGRYRDIIEKLSLKRDEESKYFRIHSWLGIAESYKELGLFYEAEQTLRMALASEEGRIPLLNALFQFSLEKGYLAQGEIWLQAINHEIDNLQPDVISQADLEWKKQILWSEMLAAAGDYEQALAVNRETQSSLSKRENGDNSHRTFFLKGSPEFIVNTHIASNLIHSGEFKEAARIIRDLQNDYGTEPELYVLLEKIYRATGKENKAEMVVAEANAFAEDDFGRLLVLAKIYRKYNNLSRYLEISEAAVTRKTDSLAAQRHFVEAKILNGEYLASLDLLSQLQKSYPDNSWLLSRQAEFLAKVGNFEKSLAVGEVILSENPERTDVVLLKARILWEMNRWKESVALYESVVNPSVEETLERRIQEMTLSVAEGLQMSSWWEVVTFSKDTPLSLSEIVMSPLHVVDFSENSQAVNSVVAPYYALYLWQQRLNKELSVRRLVMNWDYYHAANMLENVIDEYGSEQFLIFDLAGLYSKLDRLGDEATLYQELETQNANFPGLADAVQRNNLKRRPQIHFTYVMQKDDGWDGYKAVKQEIMKGGGWYYQSINQKWSLDLARIDYQSTNKNLSVWAWRSMLLYDAKIFQALSLSLAGGFEELESGYDTTPLFYGEITGKIADEMRAVLSVKQDVTADTLASLKRNIKRRDYKIKVVFDLFPRIVLGGFYDFIDYSDSNWTKNSNFWASYIFLPEPTLFKISYNYDYYDSKEGKKPGPPSGDGFARDDHPYWSPQDYWITRFSFNFKHQLSGDTLARGVPSYYTIGYSLGYDSDDNDLHEFEGSLNFEVAKNYTLEASYKYIDLGVYEHHKTLLSVMYRW